MAIGNNGQPEYKYTEKSTIKNWFKSKLKPTQAQFWAWMDSYWHKGEKLPITTIDGLGEAVDGKAPIIHFHNQYATNDAASLSTENIEQWKKKLDVDNLQFDDQAISLTNEYVDFGLTNDSKQAQFNQSIYNANQTKLNKPSYEGTIEDYPYLVGVDAEGYSANISIDQVGKVKTVNGKEPDEAGDIKVNSLIEGIREVEGLYSKGLGSLSNIDSSLNITPALSSSLFIGKNTGANLTNLTGVTGESVGTNIIALGENALANADIKYTSHMVVIGTNAHQNSKSGGYETIAIGHDVAKNINSEGLDGNYYNILLGTKNAMDAGKLNSVISLGYEASGKLKEGHSSIILGMYSAENADYVSNDIILGTSAGRYLRKDANSGYGSSIGIGSYSYGGFGVDGITQSMSIYMGYQAGGSPGVGQRNIGIGVAAGRRITGKGNIAIGSYYENSTPLGAGRDIAGDNNIILGGRAGVTTKGSDNFIVGYFIGTDTNGSGNVNIMGSRGMSANNTILINTRTSNSSSYTPKSGAINIGGAITGSVITRRIGIGLPITDINQVEPREALDVNGYVASDGIKIDSGNFQSTLDTLELVENVTHKLPNKSGTIALLDDLDRMNDIILVSPSGGKFKLEVTDSGELTVKNMVD